LILRSARQVVQRMQEKPIRTILSGHGEFLGRRIARQLQCDRTVVSLQRQLGAGVSRCATAHGLAVLAIEAR
jgi:hypothetical protein